MLVKQKSHAFKTDCYLLGKDAEGIYYWLEEPAWACDWYWGIGHVETYTNNTKPEKAQDINSHQHFKGLWLAKDSDGIFRNKLSDWPGFESPLSNKEQWELAELMQTIYTLQSAAEVFARGGSQFSHIPAEIKVTARTDWAKEINEKILPELFLQVRTLLTP